MVPVFLDKTLQHLGHGHVLIQVCRFAEHLRQFCRKAVLGHRVLDLLAVFLALRFPPNGEALLQFVAGLGHHGTVNADKVHVAYLLFGIERGQLRVNQLVSLLEEVKVYLRQTCGNGAARDLHVNGEIEQGLELLAGKHSLKLALAQTVGTQKRIHQKIEQALSFEHLGTIVNFRVHGKFGQQLVRYHPQN